jgi:hypothetical protein
MAQDLFEFEKHMRRGGEAALKEAERFFMREDKVHETLRRITSKLSELGIPYAVAGGMSLVAHGYTRTTVDVDILVTAEDLERVHAALDGLGYVPPFAGSKDLRDTVTGVRIEFLTTGAFPGDGKPKPIAFPDPALVSVNVDGIWYLGMTDLVQLKLASGMTGGVGRLKDLADIVELIKALDLPRTFADRLDAFVRPKFLELYDGIANENEGGRDL